MEANENWYIRGKAGCGELIEQEFIKRGATIDVNTYDFNVEDNIYFMVGKIVLCRWDTSNAGQYIQKNWKEVKVIDPKPQFKPFDKVLVCNGEGSRWAATFFSFYDDDDEVNKHYKYITVEALRHRYCIPYEGNEHLNGKKFKIEDIEKYAFK